MSGVDRAHPERLAVDAALSAHEKVRRERYEALRSAELRVHAEFKPRMDAAEDAVRAARQALGATLIAWARSGERTPYPLGTKVRKWRHHWGTESYTEEKTTGVLEVVTEETEHPGGRSYQRAAVGDLVVRLHKADGAPGLKYVRLSRADEERLGKIWRPYK